jgi:ATP-binding cassette subfamily F protein uup
MKDGSLPYEELELSAKRIQEISDLLDEKEMRWLELSEV